MLGKRTRSTTARKGAAIAAKINAKFPYSKYGRMYVERGTPDNIARFGTSFRAANPEQQLARKSSGYYGQGLYMGGRGGYWGRRLGSLVGKAELGDKLGDLGSMAIRSLVPGGNAYMNAANAAARVMQGQGEYVSNQLVAGGDKVVPSFVASADGSTVRITHKEYIGDVFAPDGGSLFQNTGYSVNPGIERTFPWLSQIASNYDEYTLHQLMFTYRSTVADFASASGQVGQVIMSTIYNASADPFSDKAQMMQYDSTMSCKTSESMIHGVECDPAKLSGPVGRFVRSNPVLVGQDINQYDHGLFNIAVAETPSTYANQAMGELWVSYTIELRKPKFFTNRGLGISRDVFVAVQDSNIQNPFGTISNPSAALSGQQNNIGTTLTQADGTFIPAGLESLNVNDGGGAYSTSPGTYLAGFRVAFPANYQGNLRVIFTARATSSPSTGVMCFGQGNFQRIFDVIGDGSDAWKNAYSCASSRTYISVFDIRVNNATNGIDNVLYFAADPGGGLFNIANCTLNIEEYNHGLSYKQDGSRDALILVDRAGTVQNI